MCGSLCIYVCVREYRTKPINIPGLDLLTWRWVTFMVHEDLPHPHTPHTHLHFISIHKNGLVCKFAGWVLGSIMLERTIAPIHVHVRAVGWEFQKGRGGGWRWDWWVQSATNYNIHCGLWHILRCRAPQIHSVPTCYSRWWIILCLLLSVPQPSWKLNLICSKPFLFLFYYV